MTKVVVVGGGYSAEVTACCLASLGAEVFYLNTRSARTQTSALRFAHMEPGLVDIWTRHCGKNLYPTTGSAGSLRGSEFIFICSPSRRPAQLDQLAALVKEAAGALGPDDKPTLVIRTVSTVGMANALERLLAEKWPGRFAGVIVFPDFTRQGKAVEDFLRPARGVVIGSQEEDSLASKKLASLFKSRTVCVAVCSQRTAEFAKFASDGFLATKLSFINELSEICESHGVDATEVARLLGIDPDIGSDFFDVGLGWGGNGLVGSTAQLRAMARSAGTSVRLLSSVENVNRRQVERVVERLEQALGDLRGRRIALLGLSFKPGAWTIQPSPSLRLAQLLIRRGCQVAAYDSVWTGQAVKPPAGMSLAATPYEAAEDADAIVVGTALDVFASLDLGKLRSATRGELLLDCRNCLSALDARKAGFKYEGFGRGGREPFDASASHEAPRSMVIQPRKITVVGGGYVGLVAAGCLATFGHTVTCVDIDQKKVEAVRSGRIPLEEPGLDEIWQEHLGKNLRITSDFAEALPGSEMVFLCVGTPQRRDGSADTSQLFAGAISALESLAPSDRPAFVIKSTVPISTGDALASLLSARRPGNVAAVVSNPEFLRESRAVEDFMSPQQGVIVGSERGDEAGAEMVAALYSSLGVPIAFCDRRTAETVKYASNTYLATKVSFVNELAELCEARNIDVTVVSRILGMDPRIRDAYLGAGLGWGGSCLPKDLAALRHMAEVKGVEVRLLPAVQTINSRQLSLVANKLHFELGEIRGRAITILGLTFKPNSDDLRDSQSLALADTLRRLGCSVRAFDPVAMEQVALRRPWITFGTDAYSAASGSDAIVIATAWPEFADLDFRRLRSVMASPLIIDARNCMPLASIENAGFTYRSFGRVNLDPPVEPRPARISTARRVLEVVEGGS